MSTSQPLLVGLAAVLAEQTVCLRPEQRRAIVCDNVAELFGIDVVAL